MVFSVNSDESSQRNFTAFQNLAEQLNGTSTATASGSAQTGAAVPSIRISGIASVTLILGAALASLL
jgi:hypothetical protein